MERHKYLCRVWRFFYKLLRPFLEHYFNLQHDNISIDGPCIIISNHVTGWDPLLLAMSFPKNKIYFISSEHIFRWGLISKIIINLMAPIPRKKASLGTDTVIMSLRHLKAGHTIGLFAEGNSSWNGLSEDVFPATGKFVRSSRATLVTYRIEGGYLSAPRWGRGVRRGKIYEHPVNIYTPEQLRNMTADEITRHINQDIYENAWGRQKTEHTKYKGRNPARYIERVLFMCPKCRKIDTLKGAGNMVRCSCGYETKYSELCTFEPPKPFENIAQWDEWQLRSLKRGEFVHGSEFFSNDNMRLVEIKAGHGEDKIAEGKLSITTKNLSIEKEVFLLSDISMMSLVQGGKLLFSCGDRYFEIQAENPSCLRKYMAVWENYKEKLKGA
ncbi:MAG: lysophospholipid acyltransferase family protein [Candidatus Limivicinus sp.]|jgi:1-acyl-sn-glycerol-3-phosphate acyltransferase